MTTRPHLPSLSMRMWKQLQSLFFSPKQTALFNLVWPELLTSSLTGAIMFRTPNRRENVRLAAANIASRENSTRGQDNAAATKTEQPIPEGSEVLSILRSLQQQVSTLQAQQQAIQVSQAEVSPRGDGDSRSVSSTPISTKRKLPKELVVSQISLRSIDVIYSFSCSQLSTTP